MRLLHGGILAILKSVLSGFNVHETSLADIRTMAYSSWGCHSNKHVQGPLVFRGAFR